MKKTACKLLSLLCAVVLMACAIPFAAFMVSAEMGCDFPWTKEQTLLEKIVERDGLIDGVWFPWFNAGGSGHNLTGNDVMAKYYDAANARVEMDYYGADKIYQEIYNLKAMGFNMMAYGGSIYGEGVIYDEYGDVTGIKQDYVDNVRRLLDMCREIGMPVMWNIYFHSSSAPHYYGMQGWNIMSRMLGDRTVADHYAERFVRPLCKVLAQYPDVVALVSIADEPENEINDASYGNHFDDSIRAMFGVNRDDMIYFMSRINDVCKKELPKVPRTVASNNKNKATYSGFDLDLMGHNHYTTSGNVPSTDTFFTDADIILTEYNIGGDGIISDQQFANSLIKFRENFVKEGYKGGFQWCWIPKATDAAYYMLNKGAKSHTDFKETVALTRYYIDEYRAKYQGKTITFDTPVLYCNEGTGLVEWIPSRNATKVTIERSDDGGKTWKAILKDADAAKYITKGKGVYMDNDGSKPKSGFCYRVTMTDGKNKATSAPNNKAGADKAYKKTYQAPVINYETATDRVAPIFNKKTEPEKARLLSFSTNMNRPESDSVNLIKNGSFESTTGAQWNTDAFLKYAKVISDSTAPEGKKSLYFDTSSQKEGDYYKFTVKVKPNTKYTFSTWVKGDYLGKDNEGHASVGVWDPVLNGFMVYLEFYRDSARGSRLDQQIYPTAWDDEWHLRAVQFETKADETEITIALYGKGSQMWLDGMALYEIDDGITYSGPNREAYLSYNYFYDGIGTCDPAKSLTQNLRLDDTKNTFWQTGDGWRNGFLKVVDNKNGYGKSIKYTPSDAVGNYYIKWVDVEPNTEYVFSANVKILKQGKGKISLIEDRWSAPLENFFVEFDQDTFGDEWFQFTICFENNSYEKLGIGICDLGGEALIDNIRLFKASDAKEVTDPYKDPNGGSATAPVVTVRPTGGNQPTTGVTGQPTGGETSPSESEPTIGGDPTGSVGGTDATAPNGDTTPTNSAQPDKPAQGNVGDKGKGDGKNNKSDFPWLIIAIVGAVLLIGGGVTAFLLLRKKKQ
ncbi:MAG: carbohydrate binding domain-containing protein [Clostridia bacterium]|nr:carbohydrate binding domain-containing protein [Clostridia bacterium]